MIIRIAAYWILFALTSASAVDALTGTKYDAATDAQINELLESQEGGFVDHLGEIYDDLGAEAVEDALERLIQQVLGDAGPRRAERILKVLPPPNMDVFWGTIPDEVILQGVINSMSGHPKLFFSAMPAAHAL